MRLAKLAAAVAFSAASINAGAASVTLSGSTFDVTFDSSLVGLFGTPTIVGDVISWFPSGSPGFTAQTSSGIAVTNSTFALQVTAKDGYYLKSFSLSEGGDYFYFGGDPAGVTASGQLRVTPLPGSTVNSAITASSAFMPNAFLDFATKDWSASAPTITLAGGVTAANASIENILAAYVLGDPGYAFIEKKEAFLTVATVVPEPSTYATLLAGLGVIGLLIMRQRRDGE
ncbi:MAG: PEP-CTERM sorting domain-containing protein [Burkholderiaceae bacterium]